MDDSMISIKNDLMGWIENIYDLEILKKILDLKNSIEATSLISNINSETNIEDNFDQQFAAGMTSDELMENIASHLESLD